VKPKPLSQNTQKGLEYLIEQQDASGGWGQGGGWRQGDKRGHRGVAGFFAVIVGSHFAMRPDDRDPTIRPSNVPKKR
jgi:hypothetical protein